MSSELALRPDSAGRVAATRTGSPSDEVPSPSSVARRESLVGAVRMPRASDFVALRANAPAASGILADVERAQAARLATPSGTTSGNSRTKSKTTRSVDDRVATIEALDLPRRTIRRGMGPSDDILELKRLLSSVGLLKPRYAAVPRFGSVAKKALFRLQRVLKSMGYPISANGVYGSNTRAVLKKALATPERTRKVVKQALFLKPALIYNPGVTYPPGSARAKRLFAAAAVMAGLPRSWGSAAGLHAILAHESAGRVGVPNYTYGNRRTTLAGWKAIHKELRAGRITARSSATGLGQLLLSNVDAYYPRGRKGIGVAIDEAMGMLRYIRARYGTPANAWVHYGVYHEGY